jgi:hypothetical protein
MSGTDDSVATMVVVDVGVRSLLLGEARRRAVTRVFGVPPDDQSLLVTLILLGAAGTVVRGLAPPLPRPSRMHAAAGGAVLNTAFRGIAGPPSATMPLAGGLVAFALLSHSLRPAVTGALHEVRAMGHAIKSAFGVRYRG